MRQLTRVELDKMKKLYGFEEVGQETLTSFVKDIEKGIASAEFTKEEIGDFANVEVNSYTPIQVIGPDLSKTIRFIRHQQVRWGNPDDIVKSITDKDGIYLNTDRNQKLGLVGMPYDFDIIKAKKANIGEIRYYSGIPYRKVTSTGNSNKDWQRVKDMPKKPGAKGGEKHEVKESSSEYFPKVGEKVKFRNKIYDVSKLSDNSLTLSHKDGDITVSNSEFNSEYKEIIGRKPVIVGKTEDPDRFGDDPSSKQYHDRTIGEKKSVDTGKKEEGFKVTLNSGSDIREITIKEVGDEFIPVIHDIYKDDKSPVHSSDLTYHKTKESAIKQAEEYVDKLIKIGYKKEPISETKKAEDESVGIKQKFIPKAKEKFEKFLKEENFWKKRLDKVKIKPTSSTDKSKTPQSVDHFRKKLIDEAHRKIELAQRNQQRTLYGHDILKSAFKQLEVSRSVETSTAIKGFTISSIGYSFSDYRQGYVDFTGISSGRLSTIVDAVSKLGFEITKVEQPSKVISGSSVSSISFKPYFNESDLTS